MQVFVPDALKYLTLTISDPTGSLELPIGIALGVRDTQAIPPQQGGDLNGVVKRT